MKPLSVSFSDKVFGFSSPDDEKPKVESQLKAMQRSVLDQMV